MLQQSATMKPSKSSACINDNTLSVKCIFHHDECENGKRLLINMIKTSCVCYHFFLWPIKTKHFKRPNRCHEVHNCHYLLTGWPKYVQFIENITCSKCSVVFNSVQQRSQIKTMCRLSGLQIHHRCSTRTARQSCNLKQNIQKQFLFLK